MGKKTVTLDQLSATDLELLQQQLKEKQNAEKAAIAEKRNAYKAEVDATVVEVFDELKSASDYLGKVKKMVIDKLKGFIKSKSDLYGRKDDQTSHSFSTSDGKITVIIGHNIIDGWDDTVHTGIGKVNDYITNRVKDSDIRGLILKLLSKDTKGNLKASRVLQLKQFAEKSGDAAFIDAIEIIQSAYRPTRTKEFVRCEYKKDNGENFILPLSITDAELLAA